MPRTLETCFQLSISYPRHFCESSFSPTIIDKLRESIKKNCLGSLTDVPRVCAFGRGNTSSGAVPCDQTAETKAFNSWGGSVNVSKVHVVSCAASEQNTFVRIIKRRRPREWMRMEENSTFGSAEAAWTSLFIPCLASPAIPSATFNGWAVNRCSTLVFSAVEVSEKQFGLGCFKAVSLVEKPRSEHLLCTWVL